MLNWAPLLFGGLGLKSREHVFLVSICAVTIRG